MNIAVLSPKGGKRPYEKVNRIYKMGYKDAVHAMGEKSKIVLEKMLMQYAPFMFGSEIDRFIEEFNNKMAE